MFSLFLVAYIAGIGLEISTSFKLIPNFYVIYPIATKSYIADSYCY